MVPSVPHCYCLILFKLLLVQKFFELFNKNLQSVVVTEMLGVKNRKSIEMELWQKSRIESKTIKQRPSAYQYPN